MFAPLPLVVLPILLDRRPGFVSADAEGTSLLLAPVGAACVAAVLQSGLTSAHRPTVVSTFEPSADYREGLRTACGIDSVIAAPDFRPADVYEPSDWLLFIDPSWCTLDPLRLSSALKDVTRAGARATHLVAMSRNRGGMGERVELTESGDVRRVQRYYDTSTWSMMIGVASSLVSAASLRLLPTPLPLESLSDLRAALAARGVPSRDVTIEGAVFDLAREHDFIRLNEQIVLDLHRERGAGEQHVDPDAVVHAGSRLVGPVVVQRDACIAADAVVIGPAVIGAGARIGEGAIVVHSVVANNAVVPAETTVRGRAIFYSHAAQPADDRAAAEPAAPVPQLVYSRRGGYAHVKAAIDRIVALVALVLLAPLMALIAVLIKLESRGTVLFGDVREGRGGRLFRCVKFRTMGQGSDLRQRELLKRNELDGPQFKLDKDPRVTRLGRWLRPMSLDELPQLINVARGEMSLIGPRPSPFRENQTCVPWREARLSVLPGITGLWQVCRNNRQDGDFHQWIYFDLLYVQHMSFWLDLKIVIATILTRGGKDSAPLHWMIPASRLKQ